jgi:hypothetical protein
MHGFEQESSATYRSLSDVELAKLRVQMDSLTDDARIALTAEIKRRGIGGAPLMKLYLMELHHEAQFDQRQKEPRKWVLGFFLLGRPKKVLYFLSHLLFALALMALFDL